MAFFAKGKLLKVSVEGGAPIEIADAPFGSFGAVWADDDSIVFDKAFAGGGLMRVSADGGDAEPLTTLDASGKEIAHRQPRSLPDGRGVLLHIEDVDGWRAAVRPAESGAVRTLRGIPADATLLGYLPSRHLVYTQSGGLWAVPFDLETLQSTGSPIVLLDGIYSNEYMEYVAISQVGTLVYAIGETKVGGGLTLAWVDREGRVAPVAAEPAGYAGPGLSPDGSQLAVNVNLLGEAEAWILDFVRGTRTRVEQGIAPTWTPDGRRVTYSTATGIYSRRVDGSGEAELVLAVREGRQFPMSWSPDGRSLVFYEMYPSTERDIWMLPPEGEPVPLVVTEANERSPRFSRNGRWLAYVSDESGRDEIYVQAFPGPGGKQVISTNGGREPVWSRDGTELFYRRGDELLAADVDTGDELEAGTPRTLLTARFARSLGGRNQNYDVSLDGKRFVYVQRDEGVPRELRVVVNWFEELERLAPP